MPEVSKLEQSAAAHSAARRTDRSPNCLPKLQSHIRFFKLLFSFFSGKVTACRFQRKYD